MNNENGFSAGTDIAILIVDDSEINRSILREVLADKYSVLEAVDGRQALDILRGGREIALVILDIVMPVLDGFQVLETMRAEPPIADIPVVIVTSDGEETNKIKAFGLGAWDVMTKPYSPKVVLERIRNILDRREALMAERSRMKENETRRHKEQRFLERHDLLTGLLNRGTFLTEAAALIRSAPADSYVLTCLDIDGFKMINDRLGYEEGDRLLRFIADLRREAIKGFGGLFCRDTADVFIALLPNCQAATECISEGLLRDMAEKDPSVGLHIGHCLVSDPTLNVSMLIDRAMLAVRSVKNSANDTISWFSEDMLSQFMRRQELLADMRSALAEGQFVLYFQPQYDYASHELIGAEVLVRWYHPAKGIIPPGSFIPLFEENGFIANIDEYVREQACSYLRAWIDRGLEPVPLSVNVSRKEISDTSLPGRISRLLRSYELDPSLLHIEITESAYVDQPEQLIQTVTELRRRGFTIEMDDFGRGYSSLNTLKDVPVDVLKLDMEFNSENSAHSRAGSILSSVVRMAHCLRMPVIAEGVETKRQADYLKSIGCYIMQGFCFARPMPAEEYERILAASRKDEGEEGRIMKIKEAEAGAVDFMDASTQATLLFNSFVGGALIVEYDGRHVEALRANDQFFRMVGCTPAEFDEFRLDLLGRFYPESQQALIKALEEARNTGRETLCELHCLPIGNNHGYWAQDRIRCLDGSGQRWVYYISVELITERKELDETRRSLDAIVRNMPAGVVICELDEHIRLVYASDKACELFGYTPESAASLIGESIPPGLLVAGVMRGEALRSDGSGEATMVAGRRDGSRFWLRIVYSVVKEDGCSRLYATLMDVTEQRMAAEESSLLLGSIPGGFFKYSADDGDTIEYVNANMLAMLGYTRQEFDEKFGGRVSALVCAEDRGRMEEALLRIKCQSSHQGTVEFRIEKKNGVLKWVHAVGYMRRDLDDRSWVYMILTDMNRREDADNAAPGKGFSMPLIWEYNIGKGTMTLLGEPEYDGQPLVLENVPESMVRSGMVARSTAEDFLELHRRVAEGEPEITRSVLICRTPDSAPRWMRLSYHTVFADGKPVSAVGSATDISAETEAAVRSREFELALDSSSLYFWSYDLISGRYNTVNKNAAALGIGARGDGEWFGLRDSGCLMPDGQQLADNAFNTFLRSPESCEDITLVLHMDRQRSGMEWMRVSCAIIRGSDGTPVSISFLGENCTEAVKNELMYTDALAGANVEAEGVVLSVQLSDLTADRVEACNGECSFAGESYERALEQLVGQIQHPRQREETARVLSREGITQAFQAGQVVVSVEHQRCIGGERIPRWVRMTAKTFRDTATGHLKSLRYSVDIDREVTDHRITEIISSKSFEMLALIYVEQGYMRCYQYSELESGMTEDSDRFYDESLEEFITQYVCEESRGAVRDTLSLEGMRQRLEKESVGRVMYPVNQGGERRYKRWSYCWLDDDRQVIALNRTDVTDLKALQEHSEELSIALSAANAVVCRYDVKRRALTLPESYAAQVDQPTVLKDIPYSTKLITPGSRQAYMDFFERILRGEERGEAELQFFVPTTNELRWERSSFATYFDGDGAPESAIITIRNVTAQREQEISNERYRLIVEQNRIAVVDYDANRDILHVELYGAGKGLVRRDFEEFYDRGADERYGSEEDIRRILGKVLTAPDRGTFDYRADIWGYGCGWVRLHYSSLADDSGRVYRVVGQISDIQKEKEREEYNAQAVKIAGDKALANACDTRLITQIFRLLYDTDKADEAARKAIGLLGSHYGVSRAYIIEDDSVKWLDTGAYEWCAPGTRPLGEGVSAKYGRGLSGLSGDLFGEEQMVLCPDINELPDALREPLAAQGVRGLLMCKIVDNGVTLGMIGLDDCIGSVRWSEEMKNTLSLAAMMMGNFLSRWRRDESAVLSADFIKALDDNTSYIYIIDPESYRIIYTNKALSSRFDDLREGEVCYKTAVGLSEPCASCPIRRMERDGVSEPVEIQRKDGLWMLSQASVIHWEGRAMHMVTCTDITAQKNYEAMLQTHTSEYAALVRQNGKHIIRYEPATGAATSFHDDDMSVGAQQRVEHFVETMLESGVISPEGRSDFIGFIDRIHSGEPEGSCDISTVGKDGSSRWLHADYSLIYAADGSATHAMISYFDNTEAYEREKEYSKWRSNATSLLLKNALFAEINLTRDLIEREENLSRENDKRRIRRFSDFVAHGREKMTWHEDIPAFLRFFDYGRLLGLFDSGCTEDHLRYRVVLDGRPQWFRVDIKMTKLPDTGDIKMLMVYTGIDEEMRDHEGLVEAAERDAMTRLYNRVTAERRITELLAAGGGERCAFMMIDLDDLKKINDRHGHAEGDYALRVMADMMRQHFRRTDILGRAGGDEFFAFLYDITEETTLRGTILAFMRRINNTFIGEDEGRPVCCSMGVTFGVAGQTDFATLYRQADRALYHVKRGGKNSFAFYTPEMENSGYCLSADGTAQMGERQDKDAPPGDKALIVPDCSQVISVDLTGNTCRMISSGGIADGGETERDYEDIVAHNMAVVHPDERGELFGKLSRQALLRAYAEGRSTVVHECRYARSGEEYRQLRITVMLTVDDASGNIGAMVFTYPVEESVG